MFKGISFKNITLALGIICCTPSCSNDNDCGNIKLDGYHEIMCDDTGTKLFTGCTGGELHFLDCKDVLSATALCSENIGCYEPCTTENDIKEVCIDHTTDTDYCELKTWSGECSDIPAEQRPNGYRHDKCVRDEVSGTLYWRMYGEVESCFRNSASTCCLEAGKRCDYGFKSTCDEETNTLIYCNCFLYDENVDFLVKRKDCHTEGPGYYCESGECISGE